MKIFFEKNTLFFEGILDETSDLQAFEAQLQKGLDKNSLKELRLDVSKITRANSSGIMIFLRLLKKISIDFSYIGVPSWLVNQFNMVSQFLPINGRVESIQVPFFCEVDDEEKTFTLEVGTDIELLSTYLGYDIPERIIGDQVFEIDVAPSDYFQFLCQIRSRYDQAS